MNSTYAYVPAPKEGSRQREAISTSLSVCPSVGQPRQEPYVGGEYSLPGPCHDAQTLSPYGGRYVLDKPARQSALSMAGCNRLEQRKALGAVHRSRIIQKSPKTRIYKKAPREPKLAFRALLFVLSRALLNNAATSVDKLNKRVCHVPCQGVSYG